MDPDQAPEAQTDPATTDEDDAPAVRPPTVPNVTPGAKSGLDHQVIGSAAQEAYDATAGDQSSDDDGELEVPEGDLESQLEWVRAGADYDEKSARGDAVYAKAQAADAADDSEDVDLETLSGLLTNAVYGPPADPEPEQPAPDADGGNADLGASDESDGSTDGDAASASAAADDAAQGSGSEDGTSSGDEAAQPE